MTMVLLGVLLEAASNKLCSEVAVVLEVVVEVMGNGVVVVVEVVVVVVEVTRGGAVEA